MKYTTVCGDGVENLTRRVNRAIVDGWEPVGGIFVLNGGGIQEFYQSLVWKSPTETVDCEDEEDDAPHVREIVLDDDGDTEEWCTTYRIVDIDGALIKSGLEVWDDAVFIASSMITKTGKCYKVEEVKIRDMTPSYLLRSKKS